MPDSQEQSAIGFGRKGDMAMPSDRTLEASERLFAEVGPDNNERVGFLAVSLTPYERFLPPMPGSDNAGHLQRSCPPEWFVYLPC